MVKHAVRQCVIGVLGLYLIFQPSGARAEQPKTIDLAELDLSKMSVGWGQAQKNKSIEGKVLTLGGQTYERGVGSHADSILFIELDGKTERFTALVGVDDETNGRGSVQYIIYGDGKHLYDSGVVKGGDKPKTIDLDLQGVKQLVLKAADGEDNVNNDHADWVKAVFTYGGAAPRAVDAPREEKVILTPKPGPEPRINGPKVYGARPGNPFLYRVPVTGRRPLTFEAADLPETLRLDSRTGIITGTTPGRRGEHRVMLKAKNTFGEDTRPLAIVVGDTLALTPPMGWNSWYIHYLRITDKDMRGAADAMIASGMADFGYMYVNIDDCWMVKPGSSDPLHGGEPRDATGAVRPNGKFPDMKALTDYIHSKGLKAGLYTSPGPLTCAGYVGSYQHEEIDARTFAEWGFDFLKYDWCSYGRIAKDKSRAELTKPYILMGDILKRLDRDIVLNLCQYGMGQVWKWGGEVGGHCWRTTGDLGLSGGRLSVGIYRVGLFNATLHEHAGPGRWNDPDYILIGHVGDAHSGGVGRPTTLTPNEQYSHMSMWCLMAAPLIFSGDMTKLDDFTLNILCNAEVIEVDQDRLGRQGRIISQSKDHLILAKELEDGSLAVGLFNLGEIAREVSVTRSQLGLKGRQRIRDLWRQENIGTFRERFEDTLARHGVRMVRLFPEK